MYGTRLVQGNKLVDYFNNTKDKTGIVTFIVEII